MFFLQEGVFSTNPHLLQAQRCAGSLTDHANVSPDLPLWISTSLTCRLDCAVSSSSYRSAVPFDIDNKRSCRPRAVTSWIAAYARRCAYALRLRLFVCFLDDVINILQDTIYVAYGNDK